MSVIALPTRLMYQNTRGITGLPCRCDAMNWITQRPPNMSAPVSPMTFHGDMCSPVHCSHAIGSFMKSIVQSSSARACRQRAKDEKWTAGVIVAEAAGFGRKFRDQRQWFERIAHSIHLPRASTPTGTF